MNRHTIRKIETDSGKEWFLIIYPGTVKQYDLYLPLSVMITDCESTYSGVLSQKDLDRAMSKVTMHSKTFMDLTYQALLDGDEKNFSYSTDVLREETEIKFTWKKVIEPDNIKFQLGSLSLSKENCHQKNMLMLEKVVEERKDFQLKIAQLEKEVTRLSSERQDALDLLNDCITKKESVEKKLFANFLTVLNEKKAEIMMLTNGKNIPKSSGKPKQEAKPTYKNVELRLDNATSASDEIDELLFDESQEECGIQYHSNKTQKQSGHHSDSKPSTSRSLCSKNEAKPKKILKKNIEPDSDSDDLLGKL